ncbi:putative TRAP dicarboxylate transporter, DctM subunit [Trichinella spiralis]|uniref:putative TRAP dicarboxylate transporter, DctM subunit n=1 Tax=Trichinella spiralis TaxID=6334 RepID=UPI0001EFD7F2|nr:putative TRAP dicarboxylate transporter, DctM subunit [Trichinella spiralis]
MSPSNVGNFGIGLVELVLGSLFLVAGGWVISVDDGVSAVASILQCRSFGIICSGSAPWGGHVSCPVIRGRCSIVDSITSWIHRSPVRIRLGGPENVLKNL